MKFCICIRKFCEGEGEVIPVIKHHALEAYVGVEV
jgi:hypothetical protein